MADLIEVTVKLPADLIRDASEFDLLSNEMLEQLLREELDQRVNALVNEEIHAYRREKRTRQL